LKDHHLAKPDLLVVSANNNFSIQLGLLTITTARNLGVVTVDQLYFTYHISRAAWSCRFALYNIRRIRPFLSEHDTQLLVLSRLNYCNTLSSSMHCQTSATDPESWSKSSL